MPKQTITVKDAHTRDLIRVRCMMFAGAFSGEAVFCVGDDDNPEGFHIGVSSRRHLFYPSGKPVGKDELYGTQLGRVSARVLQNDGDKILVSLPDDEVINIRPAQIVQTKEERSHEA